MNYLINPTSIKKIDEKQFQNGVVYAMETEDGYPIEVTDTFLPYYTKDAIGRKQNALWSGGFWKPFRALDDWCLGDERLPGRM
jgi:hypothetical protein